MNISNTPLNTQILEIFEKSPSHEYNCDEVLNMLKSTPNKRELIKNLNYLVTEKKLLKNDKNSIKYYKLNVYIPENIVVHTNITKVLFFEYTKNIDISQIEKICWKNFQSFCFATLQHKIPFFKNEYFIVIKHHFENSLVQMLWYIQEKINFYQSHNYNLDICILCHNQTLDFFKNLAEFILNRKIKVQLLLNTEKEKINKWCN